jgi:hypothetical protein
MSYQQNNPFRQRLSVARDDRASLLDMMAA